MLCPLQPFLPCFHTLSLVYPVLCWLMYPILPLTKQAILSALSSSSSSPPLPPSSLSLSPWTWQSYHYTATYLVAACYFPFAMSGPEAKSLPGIFDPSHWIYPQTAWQVWSPSPVFLLLSLLLAAYANAGPPFWKSCLPIIRWMAPFSEPSTHSERHRTLLEIQGHLLPLINTGLTAHWQWRAAPWGTQRFNQIQGKPKKSE